MVDPMRRVVRLVGLERLCALVMLGLLASSCTSSGSRLGWPQPQGELLASIKVLRGEFSGPVTGETGYFFYLEDLSSSALYLGIHELRDGRAIDVLAAGPKRTRELLDELDEIGCVSFDFEVEVQRAAETKKAADDDSAYIVVDGNEWEIYLRLGSTEPFVLQKWNPSSDFANYAAYSENLSRLIAVLKALSAVYGEARIGLL